MDISTTRRDGRKLSKCPRIQTSIRATADAIEQACGGSGRIIARDDENGVVRVKIVMSKQQLRQMAASLSRGRSNGNVGERHTTLSPSLEHLLYALRRQWMKKAESNKSHQEARWTPALRSIPEEI